MDATETLETLRNAVPGAGAPGAPTPRPARRGDWTVQRVLTWLTPVAAVAIFAIALGTPAYSGDRIDTLACVALASAGLAVAPRWPLLALALALASSLVWLIPGSVPISLSYEWTSYITALVAALLVVALLTFQPEPARSQRRLMILTGVSAVLLAGLQTLTATFGAQTFALGPFGGGVWSAMGWVESRPEPDMTIPSPLGAITKFGGPILAAYLAGFLATVVTGWVVSLILASRSGTLASHPWLGSSRLAAHLRRPRFAASVLIGTASALFLGITGVQNAYHAESLWFALCLLLPLACGATIAPMRPRAGAVVVGITCLATSALGFSQPWFAGWNAAPLVAASTVAILVVLLSLPLTRSWWFVAAALVVLGAALFTPFTALRLAEDARSAVFSEVFNDHWFAEKGNDFPFDEELAAMSESEQARITQLQNDISSRASAAAYAAADARVPGGSLGTAATIALGFLQALPLFLLPAVLAWGLKLTTSVTLERRRLAQARAALEASEQDRARQDERRGIAGDVHDVLAHSLTVIVAQGEGALVSQGTEQQDAVRRMVDVARASLRDVRALIERLDGEDMDLPSPGLDSLPALLQNVRDAGLCLETEEFGERLPLGDSTELALYRILQEALTNVLTHGGRGATARLVLDWRGEEPGLTVTLASTTTPGGKPRPGTGLGLEGMRTRAAVAGGWLTAGPDDASAGPGGTPASETGPDGAVDAGSGWLVTAHLPAVAESAVVLR